MALITAALRPELRLMRPLLKAAASITSATARGRCSAVKKRTMRPTTSPPSVGARTIRHHSSPAMNFNRSSEPVDSAAHWTIEMSERKAMAP